MMIVTLSMLQCMWAIEYYMGQRAYVGNMHATLIFITFELSQVVESDSNWQNVSCL